MDVRVATTLTEMKDVWRLTHDEYVRQGYCHPQPDGLLRHYSHLDFIPETIVVVAYENEKLLGTNSFTIDNPRGLHVDHEFADVTNRVRAECCRRGSILGASWRIVTRCDARSQLSIIRKVIGLSIAYTLDLGVDTVLCTFNPRHERFYKRMLGFRTIADVRVDHSVNRAPAVLMRAEMQEMAAILEKDCKKNSAFPAYRNVAPQIHAGAVV